MSVRHPLRAALLALALWATTASAATAAQVTLQPSPAEARTFATTDGGWTSAVDYGGLVCIPGVTCPTATPSHQTTGGAGGAGDGFLRNGFGTLLGVLSTTTITWSSPSFVAPTTDAATLSVAVRPQVASLLAIGSLRLDMRIVDVADGTRSRVVANVPLTAASASFSTVQATVPPGTLVGGRTYRVALDTALTTSVSAVTSGNVDLDDVVLRLVDLQPPSALTAAFQTTGAARVEGSVDPAGQTTSVVVEYGPTAAYGNSTAPVTVDGAGSQPFTIPLAGVTPGQTYHYRVTATNADGSVSTSDASFVAPVPPADSPPTVTGAGNSRTRTVTYDRPADVTDAGVEILAGGAVVDTVADADADGSVTITLPDADGAYEVRVVRTGTNGLSSTSAAVPALLDRVGPDVTAVAVAIRPQISRDAVRLVEYVVPGDVVSVLAQVVDARGADVGAPVAGAGGSAIVQLGTADGDYRVRLTLTDAAGNAATVLSGIATVDASAPSAGGAPVVTGAGSSRDRAVAFDRDATTTSATIEVLDGAGNVVASTTVLAGDSGSVTLPDADGGYTIRVRQSDGLGNESTTAATPVLLDRVAPSAGPAPTVAGDPDALAVSFTRAPDAASATIEVLDGAGNVVLAVPATGSGATIDLPDAAGDYGIRVRQTDAAGNSATSPTTAVRRTDAGGSGGRGRDGDDGDDGGGGAGGTGNGGGGGTGTGSGGGTGTGSGGGTGTGNGTGTGTGGQTGGDGGGTDAPRLTDAGGFGTLLGQCFGGTGELVLTDVALRGARVTVRGATRYAPGTAVSIVDLAGTTVGTATVGATGRFATPVTAPRAARARRAGGYRAVVGGVSSRTVKVRRANVLSSATVRGTTITLRGRVDVARLGRLRRVRAYGGAGAAACRRSPALRPVGRTVFNRRTGAYRLRVRAPAGSGKLVVRTRTFGSKLASRSSFLVK